MKLLIVGHKFTSASTATKTDGTTYQKSADVELQCIRKMTDPSFSGFSVKSLKIKDNNPFFKVVQDRIGIGINGACIDVDTDVNVVDKFKYETVTSLEFLDTPFAKVVLDSKEK